MQVNRFDERREFRKKFVDFGGSQPMGDSLLRAFEDFLVFKK